MPVIVIANPKGGAGKSTLATNVAGFLASRGRAVMLGDVDRQQSSRRWLELRSQASAPILGWDGAGDGRSVLRPPKGATHVVLDTPAGLHGNRFDAVMRIADRVLVPLQPSLFDIQATHDFLRKVAELRRPVEVGLVGMRVREHTISNEQLHRYLATLEVPVVAWLRDTQNYVQLSARGLTLWDVAPSRVERDLEQWRPLAEWLER